MPTQGISFLPEKSETTRHTSQQGRPTTHELQVMQSIGIANNKQ